jgi:hypothetical protein
VVVVDGYFFGTLLRHTKPYCYTHHNANFLHLEFDRWGNEVLEDVNVMSNVTANDVNGNVKVAIEIRDKRKCGMPGPDHCGRSPATMALDCLPILELAKMNLFARKFDDMVDSVIKDVIDEMRQTEEDEYHGQDYKGELLLSDAQGKIGWPRNWISLLRAMESSLWQGIRYRVVMVQAT